MKKITIMLILAFVLTLTASMALADDSGSRSLGPGPVFEFPEPAVSNLTADQSAQIQALRESFLKETAPLQEELLEERTELRNVELMPEPDPAAIKSRLNELSDLRAKLEEETNSYKLEVDKVLKTTSKVKPGEIFQVQPENDDFRAE